VQQGDNLNSFAPRGGILRDAPCKLNDPVAGDQSDHFTVQIPWLGATAGRQFHRSANSQARDRSLTDLAWIRIPPGKRSDSRLTTR